MTIKDFSYIKTNSVNHLYIIANKINGYSEESKGNKYLRLVPTDGSKDKQTDSMTNYETKLEILLDQ